MVAGVMLFTFARTDVTASVRDGLGRVTAERLLEALLVLVIIAVASGLPPFNGLVARLRRRAGAVGRPLADLVSASPGATLAVGTVLVALVWGALAWDADAPTVLGDELLYADLAKGVARTGLPSVRGALDLGHTVLYPYFLSPAYVLSSTGADALEWARLANVLVMTATAIPAYLLARLVVGRGYALGVAGLSVTGPWLVYSSYLMTEALFYPLFIVFALLFVRMLDRPTRGRQLAVVGALAVLVLGRAQALALVGTIVLAIAIIAVRRREVAHTVREYLVVLGSLAAGGAVLLVSGALGLGGPTSGYSVLLTERPALEQVLLWAGRTVGVFAVSLGVLLVLAFPLALWGLTRPGSRRIERAFALGSFSLVVGVLASVARLSASEYGLGILHERNLFFVVPVVLACGAHWLAGGLRRPRRAVVAAVAVGGTCLSLLVPASLIERSSGFDSPSSAFLRSFDPLHGWGSPRAWLVGFWCAAAIAIVVVRGPLLPIGALVLAFLGVTAATQHYGELSASQAHQLAWVDRRVGDASVLLLHADLTRPTDDCAESAEYAQQGLMVWTEWFNDSVDRYAHVFGTRGRDGLSAPLYTVGSDGIVSDDRGRTLAPPLVVVDSRQPIAGTAIERFAPDDVGIPGEGSSLTLWRADVPLRLLPAPSPLPARGNGTGC